MPYRLHVIIGQRTDEMAAVETEAFLAGRPPSVDAPTGGVLTVLLTVLLTAALKALLKAKFDSERIAAAIQASGSVPCWSW